LGDHVREEDGKRLVTDQTVPTFKEALLRGKDRIMFKIDLKFDVSGLAAVLDELHEVGTMQQAMIRVGYRGSSVRKVKETLASDAKYKDAIILFRCKTTEQAQQIINDFSPPAIEIQGAENGLTDEIHKMIEMISAADILVEAHASDNPADWATQLKAGIRAFHTKRPRQMLKYLQDHGLHP
jgi:hypothetical protein